MKSLSTRQPFGTLAVGDSFVYGCTLYVKINDRQAELYVNSDVKEWFNQNNLVAKK